MHRRTPISGAPRGRGRLSLSALALLACLATFLTPPASGEVLVREQPARSWRVDGRVLAVAVVGDRIVVGGTFRNATDGSRTVPRTNLAAFWRDTGALDEGFVANADGQVNALESDGTSLWVGGNFTTIDGVARRSLARLSVAGQAQTGFNARVAGGAVRGISLDRAGQLYLAGGFNRVGGQARARLAKVAADTGTLNAVFNGGGADAVVNDVEVTASGQVWAAGRFTRLGNQPRAGVGRVDAVTGLAALPVLPAAPPVALALDSDATGARVFVAGGGLNNSAASFSTTTGGRQWSRRAMGDTQAIFHHDGTVYFGFHQGFADDLTVRVLAADAVSGTLDAGFRPVVNRFWGVFAIHGDDETLAIGGEFDRVEGVQAGNWARFTG